MARRGQLDDITYRDDRDALFARLEATLRENEKLRDRNAELERLARKVPHVGVETPPPVLHRLTDLVTRRSYASVPDSPASEPDEANPEGTLVLGVIAAMIVAVSILVSLLG